MTHKHLIYTPEGDQLRYTCKNARFKTDIHQGFAHAPYSVTRGSVLERPLVESAEATLWLEHVKEIGGPADLFWLMWYDAGGIPTIPLTAVFGCEALKEMIRRLSSRSLP